MCSSPCFQSNFAAHPPHPCCSAEPFCVFPVRNKRRQRLRAPAAFTFDHQDHDCRHQSIPSRYEHIKPLCCRHHGSQCCAAPGHGPVVHVLHRSERKNRHESMPKPRQSFHCPLCCVWQTDKTLSWPIADPKVLMPTVWASSQWNSESWPP